MMTSPKTPSSESPANDRKEDRRVVQKPGPPYKDNKDQTVDDDRRIRPDPRLDKLIEVEWGEHETLESNKESNSDKTD